MPRPSVDNDEDNGFASLQRTHSRRRFIKMKSMNRRRTPDDDDDNLSIASMPARTSNNRRTSPCPTKQTSLFSLVSQHESRVSETKADSIIDDVWSRAEVSTSDRTMKHANSTHSSANNSDEDERTDEDTAAMAFPPPVLSPALFSARTAAFTSSLLRSSSTKSLDTGMTTMRLRYHEDENDDSTLAPVFSNHHRTNHYRKPAVTPTRKNTSSRMQQLQPNHDDTNAMTSKERSRAIKPSLSSSPRYPKQGTASKATAPSSRRAPLEQQRHRINNIRAPNHRRRGNNSKKPNLVQNYATSGSNSKQPRQYREQMESTPPTKTIGGSRRRMSRKQYQQQGYFTSMRELMRTEQQPPPTNPSASRFIDVLE